MKGFLHAYMPWIAYRRRADRSFWRIYCGLLVIPVAAVIHHAILFRPTCMLNNTGGTYREPAAVLRWLQADPSLPIAIVLCVVMFYAGQRMDWIKKALVPINLSFLPLSVWVWDLPGTGRWVCHTFHDGRLHVFGVPFSTRYLYVLGALLSLLFIAGNEWLAKARSARASGVTGPRLG